ncbi:MAG: serine hydroxymethyltransferase, partial [Chryseobacterium sp.]
KENDMTTIAGLISEVVDNIKDENVLLSVRKKVNELMEGHALFNY